SRTAGHRPGPRPPGCRPRGPAARPGRAVPPAPPRAHLGGAGDARLPAGAAEHHPHAAPGARGAVGAGRWLSAPAAPPAGRARPVTDARVRRWDRGGGAYAWVSGAPESLRHDARWADTAAVHAALGVRRVRLVQADDTLADTCALQERAAGIESEPSPVDRADVVAWLPLDDPDATVEILQDPARSRRVVGARHLVHDDPDPGFLDRPTEIGRA